LYHNSFEKVIQHLIAEKDSPVKSIELELLLNLGSEQVRAIISYARAIGYPISSNGDGYTFTTDKEKMLLTIKHFEERISSMQFRVEAMYETLNKMSNVKSMFDMSK